MPDIATRSPKRTANLAIKKRLYIQYLTNEAYVTAV